MFNLDIILKNLKLVVIVLIAMTALWFYKDYEFQKIENKRQSENHHQLIIADSVRYTSQILAANQIKEYFQYQNSELKDKLKKDGIKLDRIQSIVSSKYHYKDTTKKETDITGLVDAIKNSIPKSQSWSDSTKCQTTKGTVSFDGEKLKVIVDYREFNNTSDGVAYWERNQWKFLGIKTRLFGKKVFTAKTYDSCGESKILKIEKKE